MEAKTEPKTSEAKAGMEKMRILRERKKTSVDKDQIQNTPNLLIGAQNTVNNEEENPAEPISKHSTPAKSERPIDEVYKTAVLLRDALNTSLKSYVGHLPQVLASEELGKGSRSMLSESIYLANQVDSSICEREPTFALLKQAHDIYVEHVQAKNDENKRLQDQLRDAELKADDFKERHDGIRANEKHIQKALRQCEDFEMRLYDHLKSRFEETNGRRPSNSTDDETRREEIQDSVASLMISFDTAVAGLEELKRQVHFGESPGQNDQQASGPYKIKELIESIKQDIEQNRKAVTIHRDASNAKFSVANSGAPQTMVSGTIQGMVSEIDRNLAEIDEPDFPERLLQMLEDFESQLVLQFSTNDMKYAELYVAVGSIGKILSEIREKNREEKTKIYEEAVAKVQEVIDDAKKTEKMEMANKILEAAEAEDQKKAAHKAEEENQKNDKQNDEHKSPEPEDDQIDSKTKQNDEHKSPEPEDDQIDSKTKQNDKHKSPEPEDDQIDPKTKQNDEHKSPEPEDDQIDPKTKQNDDENKSLDNIDENESLSEDDDVSVSSQEHSKIRSSMEKSLKQIKDEAERERIKQTPDYKHALYLYEQLDKDTLGDHHFKRAVSVLEDISIKLCRDHLVDPTTGDLKDMYRKPLNNIYREENNQLREQVAELKDKLRQHEELLILNGKLSEEVEQLRMRLAEKERVIQDLEEEVRGFEDLKNSKQMMDRLTERNQELEQEKEDLESKVARLSGELTDTNIALLSNQSTMMAEMKSATDAKAQLDAQKSDWLSKSQHEKNSLDNEKLRLSDWEKKLERDQDFIAAKEKDLIRGESRSRAGGRSNTPKKRPLLGFGKQATREESVHAPFVESDNALNATQKESILNFDMKPDDAQGPRIPGRVTAEFNDLEGAIVKRITPETSRFINQSSITVDFAAQFRELEREREKIELFRQQVIKEGSENDRFRADYNDLKAENHQLRRELDDTRKTRRFSNRDSVATVNQRNLLQEYGNLTVCIGLIAAFLIWFISKQCLNRCGEK